MTITLDDLLEKGEEHARIVLLELAQESLTPFYHLVTPPGQEDAVCFTEWGNEAEKQIMIAATQKLAREIGAVAAVWIGEAWVVKLTRPEGAPLRAPSMPMPSQHPDRIEVVVVIATDGDHTKVRSLEMKRGEAGRVVALVKDADMPMESFGRLLDGMIPPTSKTKMN